MKTKPINQEILLMTTTTFSKREWCEKNARNNKPSSVNDKLEKACWNGLLDDMLPGIVARSSSGKKLSLWQITHFGSFLELELSESIVKYYEQQSINPYLFVPTLTLN